MMGQIPTQSPPPAQQAQMTAQAQQSYLPGSPPWNADNFVQGFEQNKRADSDALYDQYLKSVQVPTMPAPQPQGGMWNGIVGHVRNAIPYMDSKVGHRDLTSTLAGYPYTPEARKLLSKDTVVRDSMDPAVVEEEADTEPEKALGLHTGRDRMDIATQTKYSPLPSVVEHETMHSYLDKKGYPYGQAAFVSDWNNAKKTNPLLSTIDEWVASSPDYSDEMNIGDINQERFAYLAQALGGGGLNAFPKELQRHYAPIFQVKNGGSK
jgi:hypothetical protein